MAPSTPPLSPATALGPLQLTVAELAGMAAFYERVVGLRTLERGGDLVRLGAPDGAPLLELVGAADAPPRPRRSSGLFHLALLVPDRAELARAIRRVVAAGWSLSGASDHLVSEAIYLSDPEGNGIEIYRDRPREQWRRRDGELEMATLPLDLDGVMAELPAGGEEHDDGMGPGTRLGHVHLQVADLAEAERFYGGALGFEVTVRGYPGALFLSAGGYHHHIGLNTWASAGGPPALAGARGLRRVAVALADRDERERITQRTAAAGFAVRAAGEDALATDPFGNDVLLTVAEAPADAPV
jgi:catechol 2,3-dioxygenase